MSKVHALHGVLGVVCDIPLLIIFLPCLYMFSAYSGVWHVSLEVE